MIPAVPRQSDKGQETRLSSKEKGVYTALLDALSNAVLDTEYTDIEANASARRDMADVKREEAHVAQTFLEEAQQNVPAFRDALHDAWRRGESTGIASYDSADPVEDAHATVLIQYLVRSGYADVRSEECGQEHYVYHLQIKWDRLRALAGTLGHRLPL
jgi:hypothetical protein